MQVGIDVKCMYTSFGGCDLSSFGDTVTFQEQPNFPFGAWTIVHGTRGIVPEILIVSIDYDSNIN